jgi:hypothetical protein
MLQNVDKNFIVEERRRLWLFLTLTAFIFNSILISKLNKLLNLWDQDPQHFFLENFSPEGFESETAKR